MNDRGVFVAGPINNIQVVCLIHVTFPCGKILIFSNSMNCKMSTEQNFEYIEAKYLILVNPSLLPRLLRVLEYLNQRVMLYLRLLDRHGWVPTIAIMKT